MPTFVFRPRVELVHADLLPDDGFAGWLPRIAELGRPCFLDSAGGSPSRFSLLGFDPLPAVLEPDGFLEGGLGGLLGQMTRAGGDRIPGPFEGGFLGALSYDLGVAGEELNLPPEPWGFPRVVGGLYCDFLVRDEVAGQAWLVLADEPGDGRAELAVRRERVLERLARADAPPRPLRLTGALTRDTESTEHCERIERMRRWIAAGDLYQANLAHRFRGNVTGSPIALYRRLRELNRAPYMGYLEWGAGGSSGALLSASPELLLELEGRRARTRPIKGTSARASDPELDAERGRLLLNSAKDLAELGMIVDLERNDLGRIAEPGSVRVDGFPSLQSFSAVHHLVCDVSAELRPDVDVSAAVAALFPGGSITGAPKLSSMERIAALEGEGRGFFTGSLGFVDLRGHACLNILIRTVLWRPRPERGAGAGEISFRVGGGITYASDARAEDLETLAKGASLAAALADPDGVADGEDPLGFLAAADLVEPNAMDREGVEGSKSSPGTDEPGQLAR